MTFFNFRGTTASELRMSFFSSSKSVPHALSSFFNRIVLWSFSSTTIETFGLLLTFSSRSFSRQYWKKLLLPLMRKETLLSVCLSLVQNQSHRMTSSVDQIEFFSLSLSLSHSTTVKRNLSLSSLFSRSSFSIRFSYLKKNFFFFSFF